VTYACAIAPLDQSTTSLGWSPGLYRYLACPAFGPCGWQDNSLQFLADPGTPVVAPFPLTVVSSSPFVVRGTVDLPFLGGTPSDIRIYDIAPAAGAGARLDKGGLLGRVAPGKRGVKWVLWGPDVFHVVGPQPFIESLFTGLGLSIVGAGPQDASGFERTPPFGGHLLARVAGPAGSACAAPSSVHGLDGYLGYLGSAADYVAPDSSVYARYGTSSQTDATPPVPSHENVSPAAAGVAAGGGLLLIGGLALGLWWLVKSGRGR